MLASEAVKRVLVSLAAILAAAAVVASCGDGPDVRPTPAVRTTTTTTSVDGTPGTPAAAWPGTAPRLGGNITKISPTHGQKITQFDTRSPDPGRPRGLCIEADFKDLPEGEGTLWFRVAFDGKEVTGSQGSVWIVASRDATTPGGRLCYAPVEGFPVGRHDAAISVQNPNNPGEPPRQIVAWKFEVQ